MPANARHSSISGVERCSTSLARGKPPERVPQESSYGKSKITGESDDNWIEEGEVDAEI
jgi:hypothetical protein